MVPVHQLNGVYRVGHGLDGKERGTSAAQSTPTISNASVYASMKRALFGTGSTSTGTSGTVSSQALALLGSSGIGGFFFFARVGMDPANFRTDNRLIVGMGGTNAALSTEPSALLNQVTLLMDSTDTNYQIYESDGTTGLKHDTGRAVTSEDVLDFYIFCPPGGPITARLVKQNAGSSTIVVDNLLLNSYLPDPDVVLYAKAQIQAQSGSTAAGLGLNRIYVETDI